MLFGQCRYTNLYNDDDDDVDDDDDDDDDDNDEMSVMYKQTNTTFKP